MNIKYAHLTKKLFHPDIGDIGDTLLLRTDNRAKNKKVKSLFFGNNFLKVVAQADGKSKEVTMFVPIYQIHNMEPADGTAAQAKSADAASE